MFKNQTPKAYAKMGIVAGVVATVATAGFFAIKGFSGGGSMSIKEAIAGVSADSVSAADIRIAVIRMDAIQQRATVIENLRKQREQMETEMRTEFERTQRALEREREEIERSQDVLSREALQRRVMEYQQKVNDFQRAVTERAQAVEASFQRALVEIQERHLDGIVNAIIERKNLSIVLDGRFVRMSEAAGAKLDITDDVIGALNRKVTRFNMDRPR